MMAPWASAVRKGLRTRLPPGCFMAVGARVNQSGGRQAEPASAQAAQKPATFAWPRLAVGGEDIHAQLVQQDFALADGIAYLLQL